jgi:hypothetical protein
MNYEQIAMNNAPKANPNEPKQSQSDPRFSLTRAPQSQNKPKRTQSKPNFPKNPESTQPYSTQRVTKKMPNSPPPERTQFIAAKLNAKPEQTQFQKQENADAFDDLRLEKRSRASDLRKGIT